MIFKDRNGPLNILLLGDVDDDNREIREGLQQAGVLGRLHTVGQIGDAVAYLRREPPYLAAPIPDLVLVLCLYSRDCLCDLADEMRRNHNLRRTRLFVVETNKVSEISEADQQWQCAQPQLTVRQMVDAVRRVEMEYAG